jgi:hypothetical protein
VLSVFRTGSKPERLIRELGDGAYQQARRCERDAKDLEAAAYWRRVALVVSNRTTAKAGADAVPLA